MEPVPLTARYVASGAGQRYWVIDNLITVKAIAAETGGAYSLFEVRTAPGYGTPLHLHRYEDTTLFVLEGTVTVRIGDRTIELDPGGYAFLPRAMPHAYTNPGSLPARLLVMASPGGVSELFIAEVGQRVGHPAGLPGRDGRPGPNGPPDSVWIGIAAEKYGIEVLPPAGF